MSDERLEQIRKWVKDDHFINPDVVVELIDEIARLQAKVNRMVPSADLSSLASDRRPGAGGIE